MSNASPEKYEYHKSSTKFNLGHLI